MMLKYNAALAAEYMRYFRQMSEEFHIANDVKVSALSHYPEVLTMEEQTEDEEILWSGLKRRWRERLDSLWKPEFWKVLT